MRYFFNIRDSQGLVPDDEGTELATMALAQIEARASARDFAIDDLRGGRPIRARCIEITNADGSVLESISVSDIANCNDP